MALIVEAVGQTGVVERIAVEGGRAAINAQPGLTYRILDASGRPVNASATVERLGDHLIIKGLPEETTVQLTDFFFVCTPNQPCALDLEGLGGARGETINQLSEPVAAMADGSFVLHAPESMATPVAPESEFSAKPALAGLGLLALAGGGGGGGGGSDGPPPPPPGSTTVTSPPVTNDPTPVISGTAIAGAQITVTLDIPGTGPVTFNTIADGNGDWSVDTGAATPIAGVMPAAGLPLDAPTTVRVLTGGTTEVATYQLSMDLVPPEAPVIDAVTGDDLVNADEARIANPAPVTVAGTAEAGSTVVVSWHGEDQVATTDAAGNWAVTFDGQEIPDGSYLISAVATDLAGNTGAAATRAVAVVTNRPSKPIVDDVAGDNIINAGESASDLAITGTTTVGTQVFVSFGGVVVDRQATLSGDGSTWSVNVSASELGQLQEGGPYQVTAYATDGTNQSAVGASEPVTVDRTPPGPPVITGPVAGDNIVNASEATSSVTVSGTAEAGSAVQVSWGDTTLTPVGVDGNGNWTAVFRSGQVPAAGGTQAISAVAFDAAGNASAAASHDVAIDRQAPTVTIAGDTSTPINAPVTLSVNFSEPVAGFGAEDITVGNGTVTSISGSGAAYSVTITPGAASGPMTVAVLADGATDQAGNPNSASATATLTVDRTGPMPTISVPGGTVAGPFVVTIAFNEPVASFVPGDVAVTNGTAAGSFSGGDGSTTFELVITPTDDQAGSVTINVPPGVAADTLGNLSSAASPQTQAFNTVTPPSLTIDDTTAAATTNAPVVFTFSFSEPVTGFDASSVAVSGGSAGAIAGSGASYTMTVTPAEDVQDGELTVSVAPTGYTDLTGNPGVATASHSQAYDTLAPTLTIDDTTPDAIATGAVVFTFAFSEPVIGFDVGDITPSLGAALSNFSGSGASYSVTVTPAADTAGTMSVTVADGAATDQAGNGIVGDTGSQDYDVSRNIEITDLFDDAGVTGPVANGGAADDPTPTITVTLSGALQTGETVALFRNGADTGLTGTQSGNDWEFEDALPLDSPYTYVAQVMSGPSVILASDPWGYQLVSPP